MMRRCSSSSSLACSRQYGQAQNHASQADCVKLFFAPNGKVEEREKVITRYNLASMSGHQESPGRTQAWLLHLQPGTSEDGEGCSPAELQRPPQLGDAELEELNADSFQRASRPWRLRTDRADSLASSATAVSHPRPRRASGSGTSFSGGNTGGGSAWGRSSSAAGSGSCAMDFSEASEPGGCGSSQRSSLDACTSTEGQPRSSRSSLEDPHHTRLGLPAVPPLPSSPLSHHRRSIFSFAETTSAMSAGSHPHHQCSSSSQHNEAASAVSMEPKLSMSPSRQAVHSRRGAHLHRSSAPVVHFGGTGLVSGFAGVPEGLAVAMEADCCGDSGAIVVRTAQVDTCMQSCFSMPLDAQLPEPHLDRSLSSDEEALNNSASALGGTAAIPRCASTSALHSTTVRNRTGGLPGASTTGRFHMSEGQAAVELFMRLNHARQTLDFVKRQMAAFARLDRTELDVWEALELLNGLREYESALLGDDDLDPGMPLLDHAFQTAEACRLAHPEADWLHLLGLLHGLGKLLAHQRLGAEAQWAVCGESFPVGCRFANNIVCPHFFSVNPDRRRRIYSSPTGIYSSHCGLKSVYMSWSAAEYLYMVLSLNKAALPPEALFIARHQKFFALFRDGGAYQELLSPEDAAMLPLLKSFQGLAVYKRRQLDGALTGQALHDYYQGLINKYLPAGKLRF